MRTLNVQRDKGAELSETDAEAIKREVFRGSVQSGTFSERSTDVHDDTALNTVIETLREQLAVKDEQIKALQEENQRLLSLLQDSQTAIRESHQLHHEALEDKQGKHVGIFGRIRQWIG